MCLCVFGHIFTGSSPRTGTREGSEEQQRSHTSSIDELTGHISSLCHKHGLSLPARPEDATTAAAPDVTVSAAAASSINTAAVSVGNGGGEAGMLSGGRRDGVAVSSWQRAASATGPPATAASTAAAGVAVVAQVGARGQPGKEPGPDSKRRRSSACAGGGLAAAAGCSSHVATRPASVAPARAAVIMASSAAVGEARVSQLNETPLCTHLTQVVNSLTQAGTAVDDSKPELCAGAGCSAGSEAAAPIVVRVVGETLTSSGGYLHRSKCIMAFQREDEGMEVSLCVTLLLCLVYCLSVRKRVMNAHTPCESCMCMRGQTERARERSCIERRKDGSIQDSIGR